MKRKWRFPFDGLGDQASVASGIDFADSPSLAVQSGKEDADINTILRRFGRGAPVMSAARAPTFGDFLGFGSYQDSLNSVLSAQAEFNSLPAAVRSRFSNDPGQMISFLEDPANRLEAAELGLLRPEVAEDVRRRAADAATAKRNLEYDQETARRAAESAKAPLVP